MKIKDICKFFASPPPFFLNNELTVCYIAAVLVRENSYGSELIRRLEAEYPGYRVSDTVLYRGLRFLMEEEVITSYWQKVQGRGRPRCMYQIQFGAEERLQDLARLWNEYTGRILNIGLEPLSSQRSSSISDISSSCDRKLDCGNLL